MAQGAAYERDGRVYFRGRAAARRAVPDEAAALRLAAEYGDHPDDPRKDDPFDVAVWQPGEQGEPAWESPWGPGPPRLACRVRGDGAAHVRPRGRRPGRRR